MELLKTTDYLLIFFFVWLATLSFFLIRANNKWQKIIKEGKKINLVQILENIVAKQDQQALKLEKVDNEITRIRLSTDSYFQKLAITRFNPFESTGGDQSFIIALLNGQNDGFIISSLHSRTNTRVYAKQVSRGKPTFHQFSKEEKELVEKAARLKATIVKAKKQID